MQGVTYFVRDIIFGPTVLAKTMSRTKYVAPLAKTVGPKIMSRTKYVTPCTPSRLFPTCKSALVVAVLRNVKFILVSYVGIYTGHLCCIVKLPDEVVVSHTKRVGKNVAHEFNLKNFKNSFTWVLL